MVLYSCSKGQGTKTKVQKFKKKEDDKAQCVGRTHEQTNTTDLALVVSPPLIRLAVSQKVRQVDTKIKNCFRFSSICRDCGVFLPM